MKFFYQHSLLWEVNGEPRSYKEGAKRHTFLSPEWLGMPPGVKFEGCGPLETMELVKSAGKDISNIVTPEKIV